MDNICELCECEEVYDFHHLIPRTNHNNKWFKKRYSLQEMQQGINVCKQCHKFIHNNIKEKVLGREYNTLKKLKAHPKINGYLNWKLARKK